MRSDYKFVHLKDETDSEKFRNAPKNSIRYQTWNRHLVLGKKRCMLQKNPSSMFFLRQNLKNMYGIADEEYMNAMMVFTCRIEEFLRWLANEVVDEECSTFQMNEQSPIILNNLDRLSKMKLVSEFRVFFVFTHD